MTDRVRLIAFYLPQFHPIPENNRWWGTGFTEWTNVTKAQPLFRGHYQPRLPADLGFYDLRVAETRAAQADLARRAGIEGFCYWHYWFAGKRLLERPFNEVLQSGEPGFPFCLGWANETWTGIWHGAPKRILVEQTYPGAADHERHFYGVLPALKDRRYIQVRGKPLFLIYQPRKLPAASEFIEQWRNLATRNGLPGIHFVAHLSQPDPAYDPCQLGFDAATMSSPTRICAHSKYQIALAKLAHRAGPGTPEAALGAQLLASGMALQEKAWTFFRRCTGRPNRVFRYADATLFFAEAVASQPGKMVYPCAIPSWDNSARSGARAAILHDSTPELFRGHLAEMLLRAEQLPAGERILFVKSWNEWAEGNYLEPDRRFGHQYLDVVREEAELSNERLARSQLQPEAALQPEYLSLK